uniref:Uncharacterized protein n=1 Tax=Parascaris univalens TaxID=6257 RepID=A0A915AGH7_PARUN
MLVRPVAGPCNSSSLSDVLCFFYLIVNSRWYFPPSSHGCGCLFVPPLSCPSLLFIFLSSVELLGRCRLVFSWSFTSPIVLYSLVFSFAAISSRLLFSVCAFIATFLH